MNFISVNIDLKNCVETEFCNGNVKWIKIRRKMPTPEGKLTQIFSTFFIIRRFKFQFSMSSTYFINLLNSDEFFDFTNTFHVCGSEGAFSIPLVSKN